MQKASKVFLCAMIVERGIAPPQYGYQEIVITCGKVERIKKFSKIQIPFLIEHPVAPTIGKNSFRLIRLKLSLPTSSFLSIF